MQINVTAGFKIPLFILIINVKVIILIGSQSFLNQDHFCMRQTTFCHLSIWLILLLEVNYVSGQKYNPHIENVSMEVVDDRINLTYDIAGSITGKLHRVELIVIDNMGNIILPDSVSGDVGAEVQAGRSKTVTWEIHKEYDVVYGGFEPRIILDGTENQVMHGGPSNLFLSMLLPGLGDYFVADRQHMKIKPYQKAAFTYGMLGLSLAAYLSREYIPPVMAPPGWYWTGNHLGGDGLTSYEYKEEWWLMKAESTDYWLFPYDSEVFLGIGIAVWITDIIWVTRKGVQNNKIRNSIMDNISLVPSNKGVFFTFAYKF